MIEDTTRRRLRGALVGYGFIAERGHLPAYLEAREQLPLDIVAIADTCEARRSLVRERLPGVRVYADHRALFAAEDALDFVDVTTPPAFHAEIASEGLARGLHVLCEKPLTTTPEDARRLMREARSARRVLFPSHNYKHAPVVKAVRDVLASGRIGDVHLVTLHTFRRTHAKGVAEWRPDWRRERFFSGGGIAMDHGSHTFYLAFEWLRGHPVAISATASTLGDFDTEDNLTCAVRFPTGMASAHLTWTAGVRKVIYTIHGSRGTIRVEDDDLEITTAGLDGEPIVTRSSAASNWSDASHVRWFASLLGDFHRAIERGEHVGPEALDALRCVELISAAYASAARGGREVSLRPTRVAPPKIAVAAGR